MTRSALRRNETERVTPPATGVAWPPGLPDVDDLVGPRRDDEGIQDPLQLP